MTQQQETQQQETQRQEPTAPVTGTDPGTLPGDDLSRSMAPAPTERTLRLRRSIPYQLTRFAAINLRMLRMVRKGHSA